MNKKLIFLPLFSILTITSCGGDTRGWPTIDFPFSSDQVNSITMNYVNKDKADEVFTDTIVITEQSQIQEIYSTICGIPYKEQVEKTIESKKYYRKLCFDFQLINFESSFYRLIYYEYGITNGKVMFDNGEVHWLPGNVVWVYENYVDKYNKKEST